MKHALTLGGGGSACVWPGGERAISAAIGTSTNTIQRGFQELAAGEAHPDMTVSVRIRREGGGHKRQTDQNLGLMAALERLIDPSTRGDPRSPLRWTCKNTPQSARELTAQGHPASASTVWRLLRLAGSSLQSNRKTKV